MNRGRRTAFRRAGIAGVAMGLVSAVTPTAVADTESLESGFDLTNEANYQFTQGVLGSPLGAEGVFAFIPDAQIVDGPADAFDGAWAIGLDGRAVGSRGSLAEVEGSTATTRPVRVAGLRVGITWTALPGSSTLRILVTMTNAGRRDRRPDLTVGSNMGSDERTTIAATSSGDVRFTAADRWLISNDGITNVDPDVLQVYGGKGAAAPRTGGTQRSDDDLVVTTRVLVPAGATRYFLGFADLAVDEEAARAQVERFESRVPTGGVLKGLGRAVRVAVVNWDL